MLQELDIKDFALIEHIRVPFTSGLNVLTGETGAGKSIVIDALNAVLGGKVGPAVIRAGAEKAVIEAAFAQTPDVSAWLKQQELQGEESEQLVVAREITKNGSRFRINGTLVNSSILQELRARLLSIHAQHEARTLLSPQAQLELLDGLGDSHHKKLKEQVRTQYARRRDLCQQLKEMRISEEERLRLLDFARFQLMELEEAALGDPQEDARVEQECRLLENVSALEMSAGAAQRLLAGADGDEAPAAVDLMQEALARVETACELDAGLSVVRERLQSCLETIEESARHLRRYREALDTDPESLAALQARLAQLAAVKRKYGPGLAEAISRRGELAAEVRRLENAQAAASELESEIAEIDLRLGKLAGELSSARRRLARSLSADIQKNLCELGMDRCRFDISFEQVEVGANGQDRLEFLIAPNPGQPPAPVSRIASGGELSRVMLSIKSIFAGADHVATVVFDEIDTGLSGRVLKTVRDQLSRLARSHQILCITHQPIIASVADNHIVVAKSQTADATAVTISVLDEARRVQSLAEMASGHANREEALEFARSLIAEGVRARQG